MEVQPGLQAGAPARLGQDRESRGRLVVKWITSTDHKVVGYLYLITAFAFFTCGGVLAMLIRAELLLPGLQIVKSTEQFNQLFTIHGTLLLLLFATPLFVGLGNVMVPLQIGSPDVAFPRLSMFSYWIFALVVLLVDRTRVV